MTIRMRSFHFERPVVDVDMPWLATVSAQGVEFGNGRIVVQWLDEDNPALMVFEYLDAMKESLSDLEIYWDEETIYHHRLTEDAL
jgi:hypothetical protein